MRNNLEDEKTKIDSNIFKFISFRKNLTPQQTVTKIQNISQKKTQNFKRRRYSIKLFPNEYKEL